MKDVSEKNLSRGFTVLEILVAIFISTLIFTGVWTAFSSPVERKALEGKTDVVVSMLEQARNQTLSGLNGAVYGVHFETDRAVLFSGSSYVAGSATNVTELLGRGLHISNISILGGGSDVIFERLTGATLKRGTIEISLIASSTQKKTISVSSVGLVSVN